MYDGPRFCVAKLQMKLEGDRIFYMQAATAASKRALAYAEDNLRKDERVYLTEQGDYITCTGLNVMHQVGQTTYWLQCAMEAEIQLRGLDGKDSEYINGYWPPDGCRDFIKEIGGDR